MEDFQQTIETNLYNYNDKIAQICDTLEIDKEELYFIQHFSEKTGQRFQRQIEVDLGYFNHGTDLVNTAIASIRGIVEIDQAESDRNLEHQIQTFGSAIAVGAIIASTSALIFQYPWTSPWQQNHGDRLHPFIIAVLVSFLSAGLVWAIFQWKTWCRPIKWIWCRVRGRSGRNNR
ncbi:hypothetical protein BI308_09375 [Roseofilum reptotaenium AO1-A]|uniref:Uncharacterized protein n=1 Tax=Roseofilum reptotaenium AO1-A TaxID=1925591 RepID=A0A1L9QTC6_9CYAN|nr:hypothetical protein BI308_09375 [Roseofilum reptotaenium AO1-A]